MSATIPTTDHIINVDDPLAAELGFTADRFHGWLWRMDDRIVVSMIVSLQPGNGHLSALFDAILSRGWTVAVPTPIGLMPSILSHKGFMETHEWDGDYGCMVDVWVKQPEPMTAHVLTYPTEQDVLTLELPFPGTTYTVVITQAIEQESLLNRYTATLFDDHSLDVHETAEQDDPALVYAAACEVAFGLWVESRERDE
jgi:hypothetical protein